MAAESDPRVIRAIEREERERIMAEVQAKFTAAAKLVPEPKTVDQPKQSDEGV